MCKLVVVIKNVKKLNKKNLINMVIKIIDFAVSQCCDVYVILHLFCKILIAEFELSWDCLCMQ